MGRVVTSPLTTSSPWLPTVKSPQSLRISPDQRGLWVKNTPVPEVARRLPNTIFCTVTAVPQSSEIPMILR